MTPEAELVSFVISPSDWLLGFVHLILTALGSATVGI